MTKESKQQAQYLLARYVEGSISDKEETMLFQLLRVETDSEEWQEMIEELMTAESELPDYKKEEWQPVLDEIFRNQSNRIKQTATVKTISHKWRWMAAAAVIVLFISGYWLYQRNNHNQPGQPAVAKTKDVEPPKETRATITLSDGRKVFLDSASNGQLALQGNVKLIKLADGHIVYQTSSGEIIKKLEYNTVSNPRGSKVIDMTLSDGSHFWLNSGSSVTFPVAFIGNERKISVDGEAYFEVAHDASKPFIVSKGATSVTVLGTHFNVNAYSDEEDIKVTLLEGSVKVSSGNNSKVIKPGQQARVNEEIKVSEVDVDEVMSWKEGIFLLNNADVPTIMRQISRWYDVNVIYEGKIPTTRFGGGVAKDQPLSKILETLEQYGLHFELDGKTLKVR